MGLSEFGPHDGQLRKVARKLGIGQEPTAEEVERARRKEAVSHHGPENRFARERIKRENARVARQRLSVNRGTNRVLGNQDPEEQAA